MVEPLTVAKDVFALPGRSRRASYRMVYHEKAVADSIKDAFINEGTTPSVCMYLNPCSTSRPCLAARNLVLSISFSPPPTPFYRRGGIL